MSSLVLEIQKDIINNTSSITTILRKALILATKLGLTDFEEWINYELKGYPDLDKLPKYRIVAGEMKAWNPFHGYQPIYFNGKKEAETFSRKPLYDPITQIENVAKVYDGKGEIEAPIPNSIKLQLLDITNGCEPAFLINPAQFLSIIEEVKTRILEWTIALEKKGILGEGLNFTDEEKEKAVKSQEIKINNFQGVLGDIKNSSVNVTSEMKIITNDFDALAALLKSKLDLTEKEIQELKTAIKEDDKTIKEGKFGPKVSQWIGKVISKAANGILKVGINVASNILTTALSAYYGI